MRGKLWFVGGLAVGFVLGARAGREKYEELVIKGRKVLDHPTVQEAAGVAQAQANRLASVGKDRFSQTRLGERLMPGMGNTDALTAADDTLAGTPAGVGTAGKSTSRGKNSGTGTNSTTF